VRTNRLFDKYEILADTFLFSSQISQSQNRVYLNAGTLMLNINEADYDNAIMGLQPGKN
jgi:hypothetical protein